LVKSQYKWNIVSADIFLLPNSSFYKEYSQIHSAPTTCRGIQFCIDDDWEIIKVILQELPEEAQGINHYPVLLIFREAKESVREITMSHIFMTLEIYCQSCIKVWAQQGAAPKPSCKFVKSSTLGNNICNLNSMSQTSIKMPIDWLRPNQTCVSLPHIHRSEAMQGMKYCPAIS